MLNIENIRELKKYTDNMLKKYDIDELLLDDWAQDLLVMPDYVIIKKIPTDFKELMDYKNKFHESFKQICEVYNVSENDRNNVTWKVNETLNEALKGVDRTVKNKEDDSWYKNILSHLL